ncbi:hypothetical protein KEJ28_02415, partial [Candidatus Bathyarchaeota archaeon]|nr:hypothetical protein [Candidatus Bathyarchaeota archaeon]
MGLFEELSRVYPLENVHPYGLVLIVPNSAFKPEWKPVLEAEGVQIYTNAYDGKVCFFLRKREGGDEAKPAGEPQPEAKPKPKPRRLEWTPQDLEVLRRLRTEGLAPSEIA